jgi:cephalosporin hydroxylase
MDFEKQFLEACVKPNDMNEHLPWISEITAQCTHATELGVGRGTSTKGFLRHDITLHSYEMDPQPGTVEFFEEAKNSGRNATLHIADTRKVEIEPTEVMLVDSRHTYDQVKTELELHAKNVSKYIFFHDTEAFALVGEDNEEGIWLAIEEFLQSHPEWQIVERRTNCSGMTLIKRI